MNASSTPQLAISVVMPCLNEADTLGICIDKALRAIKELGIPGEVIVADNGSRDGSPEIARQKGARVVAVTQPGYGAALMGGIAAAQSPFIVMGDADDSYDFSELTKFYSGYQQGGQLVQGCRLPRGGGRVLPGAMPFSHRWFGNPVLSFLVRRMFRVPVADVYCGMRGFTRELYDRLDMRCTGMEFATEMIIKAGMQRAKMVQVPITLHPDGRRSHGPHLRTLRDGWRTVRLFMVYSPKWTFFIPGTSVMVLGAILFAMASWQTRIWGIALDVHSMLVAGLLMIVGYQAILFAALAQAFAVRERMIPTQRLLEKLSLERGLVAGLSGVCLGSILIMTVVWTWAQSGFGSLDYPTTMRRVVPGILLATLGIQTLFASLFLGVVRMHPPRPH
jgi:hypothetical protein